MREIKFRVWDKKEKRMINVPVGVYPFDSKSYEITISSDGIIISPQAKEFNLMQYTGLKDKRGKEIYEGDIVKWSHPDMENSEINEVEYDEEITCYCLGSGCLYCHDEIEIIGNKYENPELSDA